MSPDSPLAPAWALIREPQAVVAGDDRIGLGIFLGQRDGQTFYNHGGGTGGFRTHLELNPASGRAVVLLINNDALDPAALLATARRPATPPAAGRTEAPIDAGKLADYPGVYAIDGQGRFTALLDATGRLRVRLTGQPFLPAYPAGADRFFLKAVAADYQFGRDADGRVDSLTLHQNGRQIPARRTAEPVPTVLFLSADQLKAYTGTYQLAPQVVFEITARAGHLFAKLTGQPALPVFPDRADHFVYDVVDAALSFERDAGGTVTALVLHQNGLAQRAPRQP